ncbi:hypothetical protein ABBQ38_008702 [Trebouxia sp. C0009 RCD-2024]
MATSAESPAVAKRARHSATATPSQTQPSGGDHGIGSSLAPLPPALASSHLALPKQSSATLDLALPKAVQDRIRKQHKLREKRHQQDQEEVKAKRQAVQNRMPCPCNSAAKSASVDAAPEDTLPGDAELPNVPQSDSAEPVGLETSTSNQHLPVPGRDMLAWTEWLGKRVGISAYENLHQLYREWVDGIEMTTGRIACLRELERLKRHEGLEWRCSGKIRKQVMERKVLIYAVLRRLPDPAGEYGSQDKAVHDAIAEVEDLRRTVAQAKKKKKKLTLSQLQDYLSQELAETHIGGAKKGGNTAFEEDVLGWVQPKCLANGNPKQQS